MRNLVFVFFVFFIIPLSGSSLNEKVTEQLVAQDSLEKAGHELVGAKAFKQRIEKDSNAQIVDVRTPGEYEKGFIEGAVNVNVNDRNFVANSLQFDTSRTIYVYCLSGGRSRSASRKLEHAGFKHVVELSRGIMGWNALSYPLVVKQRPSSTGMNMSQFKKNLVSDKQVLVVFSATWCGPCIRMKPMIKKFGQDHSDSLEILRIDVDENPDLTQQLNVQSIPYLMLFENGKKKWNYVGFMTEVELLKKFQE